MAEILVHATGRGSHMDGDWDAGDCVVIQPDGFAWGPMETCSSWVAAGNSRETWHGKFILVKVPGATVEAIEAFGLLQETTNERRKWGALLHTAPQAFLNEIVRSGEWETTIDAARLYIKEKLTGKPL